MYNNHRSGNGCCTQHRCCQNESTGSATKLGSGSSGVSTIRNLNQSLALPAAITRVVNILQMVFTNLITTIHVNRIAN
jgi:hypothetical protein